MPLFLKNQLLKHTEEPSDLNADGNLRLWVVRIPTKYVQPQFEVDKKLGFGNLTVAHFWSEEMKKSQQPAKKMIIWIFGT